MQALIAFAMLAQAIGLPGQTVANDDGSIWLSVPTGMYAIELGWGCDGMNISESVDVVVGSGGVAYISPVDDDRVCDIYIDGPVDE